MAGYSTEQIAQATDMLAAYMAAEASVLRNQSYEMPDGRKLTRADLNAIRSGRREWQRTVDRMSGTTFTRGRARRGVIIA